MKYTQLSSVLGLGMLMLARNTIGAQVEPHDTNLPDTFYFTQQEYVVAENAGEAIVRVHWISGGRDMSGVVDYETVDETAAAGSDYKPVRGTLYFFGYTNDIPIRVPIVVDEENEDDEIVRLRLIPNGSHSKPVGNSVLRITNVRAGPRLKITFAADASANISWPDDGVNRVLEKSTSPSGGDWTLLAAPTASVEGAFSVSDFRSGVAGFYRLRKAD